MEHEIPVIENAKCNEILCTKCGLSTHSFLESRWLCNDVFTRVEDSVFGVSPLLKNWQDIMQKLARLYCLNKYELEAGFEPDDQTLERTEEYCLVKDQLGLLLIVVHDQECQNLMDKMKNQKESIDERLLALVKLKLMSGIDE